MDDQVVNAVLDLIRRIEFVTGQEIPVYTEAELHCEMRCSAAEFERFLETVFIAHDIADIEQCDTKPAGQLFIVFREIEDNGKRAFRPALFEMPAALKARFGHLVGFPCFPSAF